MSKIIRFGIFGLWRGRTFVDSINSMKDRAVLAAACDRDTSRFDYVADLCNAAGNHDVKFFTDFEEFINSGIDVVFLCNYFTEHAEYAIRAMEKGIHVISECTSGSTLKKCVDLVRTVEKTGCKYMIAENYPFTPEHLELARLARNGKLGKILYAEGEYNHPAPVETLKMLTPGKYHWRAYLAKTYYCTHAMGPLMYMSGAMPLTVNARAVHSDKLFKLKDFRHNTDAIGMMFCQMDDGSLFRFTGCTSMPSPSGYRVVGDFGSAESGRAVPEGKVFVHYNSWQTPEGQYTDMIYKPELDEVMKAAEGSGHGGGDYYMIYNMVEALSNDKPIFFDVYRGCAMSAVGILGWRSILNDGATYHIPDFRKEEDRKAVENDDLTPFPDENGNGITLPAGTKEAMDKGYKIY